jgi:hypothetical protein
MSRLGAAMALFSVASPALTPPAAEFDLESLRHSPGLLGELERLAARWSVSPPMELPFAWPKAVDAPPELKAFYAIAHYWPGARLYGSQDFLRPVSRLARDGGKLTFITENQGNFRIALEQVHGSWTIWACMFGQDWLWVPMDGVRLPELLVTFGLQEMMFGSRYLTAHSSRAIEECRVAGGFVPLWRGTYACDTEWTFLWHPSGAIAGRVVNESWYWCGQMRQGPLWQYLGEPAPARRPTPIAP